MVNKLFLHCGSHLAPREEVFKVPVPVATASYTPLPYESFIIRIEKQLQVEGIRIKDEQLAISKTGQRMFGLMELEFNDLKDEDFSCVMGIRNSYDKSFATELCVGASAFVCDNLSFSSELTLSRKHTPNLIRDLSWMLTETVNRLPARFAQQSKTFKLYRETELAEKQVNDLLIRLFDTGALNLTEIPRVLEEWRHPRHPEFSMCGRSAWRFFNATTETIKGDLWRLPARTQIIHAALDSECGIGGPKDAAAIQI